MQTIKLKPEAANTYKALRSLNIDIYTALSDIVDNSIEAGASNIDIKLNKNTITIIDDGRGISPQSLKNVFSLGNIETKSLLGLSKFGFGLKTSGIALGNKITLTTKHKGKFYQAVHDVKNVFKNNEFTVSIGGTQAINDITGKTGTKIVFSDLIVHTYDTVRKHLIKHLGETFRMLIDSGLIIIRVNNSLITSIDPLNRAKTKVLDKRAKKTLSVGNTRYKVEISASFSDLPSGFYLLRNFRQISSSRAITSTHSKPISLPRGLRIEVLVNDMLDENLGVDFRKNSINPTADTMNGLSRLIQPYINKVMPKTETVDLDDQFSFAIPKKKYEPKSWYQKLLKVNFDASSDFKDLGKKGPFYSVYEEDGNMKIVFNNKHPFVSGLR